MPGCARPSSQFKYLAIGCNVEVASPSLPASLDSSEKLIIRIPDEMLESRAVALHTPLVGRLLEEILLWGTVAARVSSGVYVN